VLEGLRDELLTSHIALVEFETRRVSRSPEMYQREPRGLRRRVENMTVEKRIWHKQPSGQACIKLALLINAEDPQK